MYVHGLGSSGSVILCKNTARTYRQDCRARTLFTILLLSKAASMFATVRPPITNSYALWLKQGTLITRRIKTGLIPITIILNNYLPSVPSNFLHTSSQRFQSIALLGSLTLAFSPLRLVVVRGDRPFCWLAVVGWLWT